MDDITARRTATITQAEIEHRREIVRQADAQNRIEGMGLTATTNWKSWRATSSSSG